MSRVLTIVGSLLAIVLVARVGSAQHPSMPPGMTHAEHLAQMQKEAEAKKRGSAAMGFDQDKTTHHFRLTASGGFIEVEARDSADAVSRDAIRVHLEAIADEFASGNFSKPFATHGEMPPGAKTMQEMKSAISYRFEPTDRGGRVRISATDRAALAAVHEFLRYQIKEHATGDPLVVQP